MNTITQEGEILEWKQANMTLRTLAIRFLPTKRKAALAAVLILFITLYVYITAQDREVQSTTTGNRGNIQIPVRREHRKYLVRQIHPKDNNGYRGLRETIRLREYEKELGVLHSRAYHRHSYTVVHRPAVQGASAAMLVYSKCSAEQAQLRQTIRQTWANKQQMSAKNMTVVFVLGSLMLEQGKSRRGKEDMEELLLEQQHNNDILMFDFIDHYTNLTLKTINVLRWFASTNMSFLVKCDADVLVNWQVILGLVDDTRRVVGNEFILGNRIGNLPQRNVESKWFMPNRVYNGTEYPDFVSGTAYVMTAGAAKQIISKYYHLSYLYLEDVFITGVCRAAAHITLVPSEKFLTTREGGVENKWNKIASVHGYTKIDLIKQWLDIQTAQSLAPTTTPVHILEYA